jgi:hypothetical protein
MSLDKTRLSLGSHHIARPSISTSLLALLILSLMLILLEGLARSGMFSGFMPPRSLGTPYVVFEHKIYELDRLTERDGPYDCIFVGNSTIHRGVAPTVVEQAYREQTGTPIRCFNLGVGGSGLSDIVVMAQIAARRYHPRLIVVGINLDSFRNAPGDSHFLQSPWARYAKGDRDLQGWLIDHSIALQSYNGLMSMSPTRLEELNDETNQWDISAQGYNDAPGTLDLSRLQEFPHIESEDFVMPSGGWQVLETLADLQQSGTTKIVTIETPQNVEFLNSRNDYEDFLAQMEFFFQSRDIPFFDVDERMIPPDGWWVKSHLNDVGAVIYSRWVGEQLSELDLSVALDTH